ncbi:hypothetical protein BDP27DRAFT_1407006 [Rhodocollybia butyracea]|uniref:Mid2 domain-containing protein n=1 Tax=Rhodocollybia butyracea TaxID=206335 RepID=A0A9P5P877_9AGAR|nr:hypothetical protein BDP27DRAFT_1407006 [Rhodocollybia butyracea]
MFCVLLYALVLYVKHAFGEPNITLWQFGTDRLPHITQPLRPIGVASDELSTTYIYEVLYLTTTTDGSLETVSTVQTIIASASGWVEVFDSGNVNLECKFVNSDDGECSDENFTGTGHPSPLVLAVQTSLTSSATAGGSPSMPAGPTSSDHQSSTTPSPTAGPSAASHSSQVGAIVGSSTIAGLVCVCIVALILWLRRRRRRSSPGQGAGFENFDASQERRNHSREEIHPPMENMGLDIHPYVAPVLSIHTCPDANSTQTENGTITNSMRSKRAQA